MSRERLHRKCRISVIGDGIGGAMAAAQLVNDPQNEVTLIGATDQMFNEATAAFAQLHLGGEYIKSPQTMRDCLLNAIVWKLGMPPDIYTDVPPKYFLVHAKSQEIARTDRNAPDGLTLRRMLVEYERNRKRYEQIFHAVQQKMGWSREETEKALFGSFEKGSFYRKLEPEEYAAYGDIAGGIATQERGLNPIYLIRLQLYLEQLQEQGKLRILRSHKVVKNGVEGDFDHGFRIHCENGNIIEADQVLIAAGKHTPELISQLKNPEHPSKEIVVNVYKRGILVADLPPGWKHNPAFIMVGAHGGMISPYNDRIGLHYLPLEQAAYYDETRLDAENPSLPDNWDTIPDYIKQPWTERYFRMLKERFPMLRFASNPRLIIADTLNFEQSLATRPYDHVAEVGTVRAGLALSLAPVMQQKMELWSIPGILEVEKGKYTLFVPKGTYAFGAGIQARVMLEDRWLYPWVDRVLPPDPLSYMLDHRLKRYRLNLPVPGIDYIDDFLKNHPNVQREMLTGSWPQTPSPWAAKVARNSSRRTR